MDSPCSHAADSAATATYRDETKLDLVASRLARKEVVQHLRWEAGERTVPVLPAAGVFGANASGKSTILRAMADMRALVLGSFRHGSATTSIPRKPFQLDAESAGQPTRSEIDLVLEGVRWQYGFEIDDRTVRAEYALYYPNGRQASVFDREGDAISFGRPFRSEGRLLERLLRPNALLVSVAGAAGQSGLEPIFEWFQTNLLLAESDNSNLRSLRTADLANSDESRDRVLALLCAADLGIIDISREAVPDELRSRLERVLSGDDEEIDDDQVQLFVEDRLRLIHCGEGERADFDAEDESLGTMVWVGLVGPVLDALDRGDVL
ncbi:MAG: ATP-binding protein, partial [Actinomycetia bacterium]|nr:ATP-binding protein [Actinomycetes bacterium]